MVENTHIPQLPSLLGADNAMLLGGRMQGLGNVTIVEDPTHLRVLLELVTQGL